VIVGALKTGTGSDLKESLAGTKVRVAVGLRQGSGSMAQARSAASPKRTARWRDVRRHPQVRPRDPSHLRCAQAQLYKQVFGALSRATLGCRTAFFSATETTGEKFSSQHQCDRSLPKGMGPSCAGCTSRDAIERCRHQHQLRVEQDLDGHATDIARAWSVALGAPYSSRRP